MRLNNYLPVILFAALVLRVASGSTANFSYFAIAVYALFGRTHAIHSLAMFIAFILFSVAIPNFCQLFIIQ